MIRKALFFAMLASAIGVPYVATRAKQSASDSSGMLGGLFGGSSETTEAPKEEHPLPGSSPVEGEAGVATAQSPTQPQTYQSQPPPLEGFPVHDLSQVLRFDITPSWVYQHWSRKSTALGDLNFHGVRVPLVTGTRVDDLAGSLTYYFDDKGVAQRITFKGTTGDTRKLVHLLTQRFGLKNQTPDFPGEWLFQTRWGGHPISELRIRPASVIWAKTPHTSFSLKMDLQRPGSGRLLPQPEKLKMPEVPPQPAETAAEAKPDSGAAAG